jgi:hypothetical protein
LAPGFPGIEPRIPGAETVEHPVLDSLLLGSGCGSLVADRESFQEFLGRYVIDRVFLDDIFLGCGGFCLPVATRRERKAAGDDCKDEMDGFHEQMALGLL